MPARLIVIGASALASIPRKLSFGVVAVGCALAIVACGASGSVPSARRSSGFSPAVGYADCMRSHGVPDFPDARAGGGFDIPPTIDTQSPAYLSAQRTCRPGGVIPHALSDREQLQMIAAAKCMRARGVNLADPTFNGPYMTLDVPDQTMIESPAFKRAESACHYPVPKNTADSTTSP